MPNNDSHHHVVKTTEQWQDRAVEYWVVPRGTLCVELTPEKKTKIKIGEGSKYYSQLPYICDGHDMSNYYTKEETDRLLDNLNRMAIQSTDVYDTKDNLPLDGNKLGDVRFVKSTSEQKVDPDVYLWNGSKWIYVGYDFANIDLDRYLTKTEFHSEFDPVRNKVDEMYPKMHTHDNKDVLDRTERPFTIADKEKLDSLENYDDTEIRELIRETGHVHWNKHILDTITEDKLWTVQDREKFESLHNYDDTELRNRMGVVESKAHTHTNKDILDQTTAPFKTEDKQKLDSLENYDIFIGTDGRYPGVKGLVPAPSALDIGTFLSSDGTWKKAGFDSDFIGATPYMDGEHGLVPAPLMGEQSYFLRGDGTWARVKNGDKYRAGEGITIISGEVISDTFPFEIFPKAATVTQYVIYGTASGVGNAVSGHYEVPIKVSAEGHVDRLQTISIADPLYDGDYIDFQKQVFAHYRTNINNRCTIDPQYNYKVGIHSDGTISYHDPGAYGSRPFVSNPMEIIPGATYEITPWDTDGNRIRNFQAVMYLNMYDADMNRTRTIFQEYLGNTTVIAASNEKYMRLTRQYALGEYSYNFYSVIYQLYPVETPCQLNELLLYPNVVNTVDVLTTNKPNEIYVEVEEPEDIDPDDPMSQYSGIIYNDGVLDITQEDPNALNELTVHFRDDVDKTITIPETPLEPATTTTLGGIIVGENLTIDENGVLDAIDGTQYEAGTGINIISDSGSTVSRTLKVNARTAQANDYTIYGASGGVGEPSINLMPALTMSSIWSDTWYADGTHEGKPAFSKNTWYGGITNEVYLTEGTYTFSLDVKLSSTSIQGLLANQLNDRSRYPHYDQAATVDRMEYGPFYPVDTDWHRYSYTFEVTSAGYVACRAENVSAEHGTISVARAQLESGSVAHDYVEHDCYTIPITVSAPNETDIEVFIETSAPLGNGDSINFIDDSLTALTLYQNKVNTVTINTTVAPSRFSVDASSGSDVTSVIENDGVIDVTQEDPNNLNELTFHYRDDVDKTITIPTYELPIASDTTLGGIKVGNNLTIDPVTGVLDATGGGTTYVEGNGIEFGRPILETYQVLDKIRKPSGTTLTTDVMPSGTVDFFCDLKYYKYAGDSFLILCYDGERGSFCYTPAPTASGGWARMWIYTAHENWYDLYLNGSFASSSPIVAHLRWGNTMSMSFDHTSTSAQNTPGVLPGHNRFKFDTSSDVDLYWAKFYENSALVGELIPVIRQSDNVVGMFNKVTETFSTVSGLSAGTPTGETIVIYDQSSTQNIPINAKLGDGLDFDSNDAIEVQPATTTTIGGIIVGENLTIDENGVLSATGGGGVLYDAGDGIEFTYNHMIDMLFDRTAFLDSVTSVQRGTISKDTTTGAFTITATGNDAYTYPDRSSLGTVYSIQVDPSTTYKLTWTSDDPTVHGNVFVFENGDIITSYLVDQATSSELTFITSSTCQTLNFRFGVQNSGDSLTYSDIALYKITGDATINAKLGNGLQFDANNGIEVKPATENSIGGIKVGEGLSVAQDGTLDVITDVITTFAEGDAIEFGTTPVPLTETITHIKWAINTIRNSSLSIIQAAEIEFYDENDQLLTFSAISGAFSPSVSTRPIYGTVQYSQTPDKLVDGSTLYKCCCTNFTSSIPEIEFTFELSTPINAQDLKNYRWFTADDQEGRDPISWEVYVSPNGGDWICVHEVTNATVPTARQTSTEYYTVNKPSFSERTINVKYGAGLALDANGALTVIGGGTEYDAGPGIEIGPSPSTLYTQVEYLKSTGTQYILTDIIPDYTMRIALDVKFGSTVLSSAKSVKKIFGYYNGASTNTSFLAIWLDDDADHGNLDYICFYDGFRWVQGRPRTNELDDVDVTTRSTVIIQRGICSWGSATCTTLDSPIAEPNPTTGMPIFAGFESNRYDIFGRRDMYLYSFKIYNSESELIHKLVPVKRNSDDELGLYDLKTNTFYTNAGTGTFTAGSDIGPIPGDDEVISTKLGVGLTFDSNDAVTLDETTDLIFNCDYSE